MKKTIVTIKARLGVKTDGEFATLIKVSRNTVVKAQMPGKYGEPVFRGSLELVEKLLAKMTTEQIEEALKS